MDAVGLQSMLNESGGLSDLTVRVRPEAEAGDNEDPTSGGLATGICFENHNQISVYFTL